MTGSSLLSVIIVNYHSAELILDAIGSVIAQGNTPKEWIVVDNSSSEADRQLICNTYPFVHWITMPFNAGFARANNEGIRQARGEVILLLNPDTVSIDNVVEKAHTALWNSDYVACGVQLLHEDGTPQISGNFSVKGGLNYLLPLPYIGAMMKWIGQRMGAEKPNVPNATATVRVDWINGAFLMVKKQAIEQVGMLDEDFFMYAEETEWCARLRKAGPLCIFGELQLFHLQGKTTNKAFGATGQGYYDLYSKKGAQLIISNLLRIRKEFGIGWFLIMAAAYSGAVPVFWLVGLLDNIIHLRNPFAHARAAAGFTGNILTLWKYIPKIISGKPHFYKLL